MQLPMLPFGSSPRRENLMETAYQSWQKMLDAGAKTLYPSHGNPFPAARLQENMGKIKTQDLIPFS